MSVHLMTLKIQLGGKYDEFLFETCMVGARIMLVFEVLLELLVVAEVLIPDSFTFTNKTLFMVFTKVAE